MSTQGNALQNDNLEHGRVRSTSSFVYPVKSLLSGIHTQRATLSPGTPTFGGDELPAKFSGAEEGQPGKVVDDGETGDDNMSSVPDGEGSLAAVTKPPLARNTDLRKLIDGDPLQPRTFISNSTASAVIHAAARAEQPQGTRAITHYAAGPVGEPVPYHPEVIDISGVQCNARHRLHVSEVAADVFLESAEPEDTEPTLPILSQQKEHPNFSQLGLVHLGAKESSPLRNVSPAGTSLGSLCPPSREHSRSPTGQDRSVERDMNIIEMPSTRTVSISSSSISGSGSCSAVGSLEDSSHTTFRYQHVENEGGHHLIVGREGKLTKCEDEPIRTPGAVQGFGVLIAVEEDLETGNLSVRQVSENSTELLGLSPSYLFSLECFTQILPDSQADLLFDNIQYLSDNALTLEEQAENLHVFVLHGFGEPGSTLQEESSNDPQQRRSWVCWCAAHRPQMTAPANLAPNSSSAAGLEQNLIILEFELERDIFNPLYPSLNTDDVLSGISSPSDASGSTSTGASTNTSGSGSSGRTLVSSGSGSDEQVYESTPEGSNPSLNDSNPSSTATNSSHFAGVSAGSSSPDFDDRPNSAYESNGAGEWIPHPEAILESTTSYSKPLPALERLRRNRRIPGESVAAAESTTSGTGSIPNRGGGVGGRRRRGGGSIGMMDVFAVMAQINEQFGTAPDLEQFMKIVVGVLKDLTQFHRVLVYQFDESWNGKVVAELVDWNKTHDLYHGLHFPASDIPAQARNLYALNKVRLLYDRGQPTARLIVRSKRDLETPLDMTHCYLRAMSPIHLKYLGNMGVRASMSVSIMAFGQLWGLVAMHSYGPHGMRVSFPVRQMLRLLSQSISRNVERLCYAQRLHTRKLINTMPTDANPSGYIVADANDLLGLFDADYSVLVIGEGAKILGPHQHGQEILVVAEYLRMKQFDTMQVSQAVTIDYPDLNLQTGLEVIAGLLYVPLSVAGGDFIAFLRKGQPAQVKWAGRPYREGEVKNTLEPRSSFKTWSETVAGRCRTWTDEQLETAGVLALVYGKFIEVWRQKESASQTTKLTNILLSNASHEVRTPLNHIINYLEMAMNGHLDIETRENLRQSHAASKSLLYTINDLLDLTRLESGNETSFSEPFDLQRAVRDATLTYRNEAQRRGLGFSLDFTDCPGTVVGDARKIRTVIANLTANALKYTSDGAITVQCRAFEEPSGLRASDNIAVELVVADTGCGIASDKLENIFREFEQVDNSNSPPPQAPGSPQNSGLGLGLAVVARIVEQLGGQLRVDSKPNEGSRFSLLIPFGTSSRSASTSSTRTRTSSYRGDQIESLVQALQSHQFTGITAGISTPIRDKTSHGPDRVDLPASSRPKLLSSSGSSASRNASYSHTQFTNNRESGPALQLRILVVEDNDINRTILSKRLILDGHTVVNTTNGQEGLNTIEEDPDFDCVLMDIQMPLLNGYEATERIRAMEQDAKFEHVRVSHVLNGRIPIFAVSASLFEVQRREMYDLGMDGWLLKPIDFKRLRTILRGVTDPVQRSRDVYRKGISNWEQGGWLVPAKIETQNTTMES
ncbi:hypothetical protein BDY19DRAFT_947972 [Irpex rosettiformis]|uniref:Uncharacterized protein n=1 Tax=Irpex rosettiformis TaxID=378272 RepID=A0ACB8U2K6_9APHY|nr:hypothetical protein BDY19DRAFT_947972 [Irpex rosettiformis]